MLGVTKLLCETTETEKEIACGKHSPRLLQFSQEKRPVVVWNITKQCNLHCMHCYADSKDQNYENELNTKEAISVIDDLADFKVPVIIFSGGDPLLRKDIFELAVYAREKGIRCALSTNGTLIGKDMAKKIADARLAYVGVSIDGVGEMNDMFRGMRGAYERAIAGLKNCRELGVRTGIRLTLNRRTVNQIPAIFELSEKEDIPRIYISHLVYSGRGRKIKSDDLNYYETKKAIDYIFEKAIEFNNRGIEKDILTGNNDADGVYLFLKVLKDDPEKAERVYSLLLKRGGNSSGVAIGCIDNIGNVHADQFWSHYSFGNVRDRRFSDIWLDTTDPVMKALKNRKGMINGRCSLCSYFDICGGSYRVRAEVEYNDIWASDPACYLTDEEIGISERDMVCHAPLKEDYAVKVA
ncbi:MAG: radical SAM protein [Nitrospirae bacterium]|nr:radical SAM protein [Nitrospirota bacterium]